MFGQGKTKQKKVECSVCQMTFDSDYRKKHNEKYHSEMIAAHRHIPYKLAGAPDNPFTFARKTKSSVPPTEVSRDSAAPSTSTMSSSSKPEDQPTVMTTSLEPEPLKAVPERAEPNTSECTTVTGGAMMEEQSGEFAEQQSTENEINVCLTSLGKYPTDPANFRDIKINAALRAEIVRCGPCKPVESVDVVFPKDTNDRSFHQSWYQKNNVPRDWLVYSMKENVMFCFCCWLFPCTSCQGYENNWSEVGVSNFKKGLEKISGHENSVSHCTSLAHWKSFEYRLSTGKTIDAHLQEQLDREREKTLQILDRIFSVTLFLALQGISFRGHRFESYENLMTTFGNSGNYLELLKLIARHDPVMASHLASKKSRSKYTSPQIQNEIIDSIARVIREKIISEILVAKYFCVILDTTPDIAHVDQLAFSVRYVSNGKPVECFLCFDEMTGSKAIDFRDKLLELLAHFKLSTEFIRGQAMDGCSTMSGIHGGLQALVREITPSALYVHCMAHRLNLVLVKAATTCVPVKSFFGLLGSLYSFFVASPRRIAQLHKSQENANRNSEMPKSLSDTRWAARANAVEHVRDNFDCYLDALEVLIADNQLDARGLSDASGLLNGLRSFDFLVLLYFWFDILVITKAATDKVQGPFLNIGVSCQLIEACIQQFLTMRSNNDHFDATIAKTRERCNSLDLPAEFETRRRRRRRGFFDETQDEEQTVDAQEKFRIEVYNVVLNTIIADLKTRFNDTTVGVLKAFDCISPTTFMDKHGDVPAESSLQQVQTLCNFYSKDLSTEATVLMEYKNIHALLNAWDFIDGEAVPRDAEDLLVFLEKHNLSAQFENIVTLLKLALTLPVSSAHDERAFSCLKRVKTYLRSTMTENRLSNLACISINRESVSDISIRELQKPFLSEKTRRIFQ